MILFKMNENMVIFQIDTLFKGFDSENPLKLEQIEENISFLLI